MSLVKSFEACTLAPRIKSNDGMPATIKISPNGTFKTTSFFIDSSGHSSFLLPLELAFATQEDLDIFLASDSLSPPPKKHAESEDKKFEAEDTPILQADETIESESSFVGFEVKSFSSDEEKDVVVEAISILSTAVSGLVVSFETEIAVRTANHNNDNLMKEASDHPEILNVLTILEITPVLSIRKLSSRQTGYNADVPDLISLELGSIPDHMQRKSTARIQEVRLTPIAMDLTLTHAFTILVNSFPGPTMGSTMVSLTIRHANSHREPVTISNIAIHPGHSRYEKYANSSANMVGSKYSVTNMTKAVQWDYAPKTELRLPLTLNPYDAYSTVLVMNAGEEMYSRLFTSPVSVTGVVGHLPLQNPAASLRHRVVVAADAKWATEIVAVEPADAFRIDMKVNESEVTLGEPMVVSLQIFNLSLEPRNLMLLMAKEEVRGSTSKDEAVNSAVVSEINGYTFGVWGISGEDDGTVRLNRDHELLAVDGALLLGELLGQHAIDAELRFVPLREGRLKVPNWKLYDKATGKWYTCVHNLCVVAKS